MLDVTQILIFELGRCNLSHLHSMCPSRLLPMKGKVLSDTRIIELASEAYNKLGFTGFIGWHFYNEPTLQWGRMIMLMRQIKACIPKSRFILWTNGTMVPTFFEEAVLFEQVYISDYQLKGANFYKQFYPFFYIIGQPTFDERLKHFTEPSTIPCQRPFVEFIVNNYGDAHLCCQDWRNDVKIGNVMEETLKVLDARKWKITKTIFQGMGKKSPDTCLKCNAKCGLSTFDTTIAERALKVITK